MHDETKGKEAEEHFIEGLRKRDEIAPAVGENEPLPPGVTHVQPSCTKDQPAPPPKRRRFSIS